MCLDYTHLTFRLSRVGSEPILMATDFTDYTDFEGIHGFSPGNVFLVKQASNDQEWRA
jgi:hypothetical protein